MEVVMPLPVVESDEVSSHGGISHCGFMKSPFFFLAWFGVLVRSRRGMLPDIMMEVLVAV